MYCRAHKTATLTSIQHKCAKEATPKFDEQTIHSMLTLNTNYQIIAKKRFSFTTEKSDSMLWIQNHHILKSYKISHIREKMVTDFDFHSVILNILCIVTCSNR